MMVLFELAVPGNTLLLAVVGIVVLIVALIFFFRSRFASLANGSLTEKYKDKEWASPLQGRAKYPDVDILSNSGTFLRFGLLLSLGLALLAMSWTTYEEQVIIPDDALFLDEEIEIEPPRTAEPPPPPPPPPPPVIEEVPEEEILDDEEPEFLDQDIEEETIVEEVVEEAPPPPPPPPPKKKEPEEIFRIVEQMPRFPGCEDAGGSNDEKKACAEKKMLEFIYKNIKYPAIARENGVEGTAVLSFVVEKNGKVTDIKTLRDPGAGTGEEAARVVSLMNKEGIVWTPGKQRGRPVRVQFTLPVKFKLQ